VNEDPSTLQDIFELHASTRVEAYDLIDSLMGKPAPGVSPDPAQRGPTPEPPPDPGTAKPANEVTTSPGAGPAPGLVPAVRPTRSPSASACEPYRELIELSLARGRNAMAIWQDLVSDVGFTSGYQSVRRSCTISPMRVAGTWRSSASL
jgi:hypothetical protein